MDDLMVEFLTEMFDGLAAVDATLARLREDPEHEALAPIFRHMHTLKGAGSFLGLSRVMALADGAEALLARRRARGLCGADAALLSRVTDRLAALLVHVRAAGAEPSGTDDDLLQALATAPESAAPPTKVAPPPEHAMAARNIGVPLTALDGLAETIAEIERARDQLRLLLPLPGDGAPGAVLGRLAALADTLALGLAEARLQPVAEAMRGQARLVRHLGEETGKPVVLEIDDADLALDREVLDRLQAPLAHLLRNAVDHGIEMPAVRAAAGKPALGTLRLTARCEGASVTLRLEDDGAGLDPDRLRTKARDLGLATPAALARMGADDLARFIFHPGFSTATTVTAHSGRGVGMDVVRTEVEALGGAIAVTSRAGQGVTFKISLPLTLAAAPAWVFTFGARRYGLARAAVVDEAPFGPDTAHRVERIGGTALMKWRDMLLPALDLPFALGAVAPAARTRGHAFAIESAGARFVALMEERPRTERLVLRPNGALDAAGATVMWIDPQRLAHMLGLTAEPGRTAPPTVRASA